jgi:hypothetical protein
LVDTVALHLARKKLPEVECWLPRQHLDHRQLPRPGTGRRLING